MAKKELVAKIFTDKDSINMVLEFFGNLITDSTTSCTFQNWGNIYFFKDATTFGDYFYDIYFSNEEDCKVFQNALGPYSKKARYSMTEAGRLFLNKLQKENNIPALWYE